jgi:hypothetical protein
MPVDAAIDSVLSLIFTKLKLLSLRLVYDHISQLKSALENGITTSPKIPSHKKALI